MSHAGSFGSRGFSGQTGLSGSSRSFVPSGNSGPSGSSRPSARSGPAALSGLSDRELLARVKALVAQERATTLEILVHLSSVSLVASILTETNKDDLLGRIRNRSQKEVEGIVADYRPPVSFRDRARPVCVAVSEPRLGSA